MSKVLGGFGDDGAEELDFDAAEGFAAEGHVEEYDGVAGVAGEGGAGGGWGSGGGHCAGWWFVKLIVVEINYNAGTEYLLVTFEVEANPHA